MNLWGCSSDAGVAFVAVGAGPRDGPEPPDGGFGARRFPSFKGTQTRTVYSQRRQDPFKKKIQQRVKEKVNSENVIQSMFDLTFITLLALLLASSRDKPGLGSGGETSPSQILVPPPPSSA